MTAQTGSFAEPNSWRRPPLADIPTTPVANCPACDSSRRRFLFDVREHEYLTTTGDSFPLVACLDCGAWYLDPRPAAEALWVIYPPNYYITALRERELRAGAKSSRFSRLADRLFRQRIRPLEAFIEIDPETRWLDVGCGNGSVLESLRSTYSIVGSGIDLSAESASACRQRGFSVQVGRFEDYEPAVQETYDVVHSSHVIEHLTSPLAYMRKCEKLLRPGGISVFITPNTGTWEARRFGRHWGGLHAPRHFCLLDPRSAQQIGEAAGLIHRATRFSTNGVFWVWSLHSWMTGRLGRRIADWLAPSDHRFVESGLGNLFRLGSGTMMDVANLALFRQSANMMVIHQKPVESTSKPTKRPAE